MSHKQPQWLFQHHTSNPKDLGLLLSILEYKRRAKWFTMKIHSQNSFQLMSNGTKKCKKTLRTTRTRELKRSKPHTIRIKLSSRNNWDRYKSKMKQCARVNKTKEISSWMLVRVLLINIMLMRTKWKRRWCHWRVVLSTRLILLSRDTPRDWATDKQEWLNKQSKDRSKKRSTRKREIFPMLNLCRRKPSLSKFKKQIWSLKMNSYRRKNKFIDHRTSMTKTCCLIASTARSTKLISIDREMTTWWNLLKINSIQRMTSSSRRKWEPSSLHSLKTRERIEMSTIKEMRASRRRWKLSYIKINR